MILGLQGADGIPGRLGSFGRAGRVGLLTLLLGRTRTGVRVVLILSARWLVSRSGRTSDRREESVREKKESS